MIENATSLPEFVKQNRGLSLTSHILRKMIRSNSLPDDCYEMSERVARAVFRVDAVKLRNHFADQCLGEYLNVAGYVAAYPRFKLSPDYVRQILKNGRVPSKCFIIRKTAKQFRYLLHIENFTRYLQDRDAKKENGHG